MISTNQNTSLWNLANEHQLLLSQLYDPETGEVDQAIQAQLDALHQTTESKCIAVQTYINKMCDEQKQLDALEERIAIRKAAYKKEVERMTNYLFTNMKRSGIKEIKCPYFKLRIKVNPYSTDIIDEKQIPERFMKTREIIKTEIKPDKTAIKEEVLATGIQVAGAVVQQKEKLEIIIDKI